MVIPRAGVPRTSWSRGGGKVNARDPSASAPVVFGSDGGKGALDGSAMPLSSAGGPDTASIAVAVGAVVMSRLPRLDMLMGLVCAGSGAPFSGILILRATFSMGLLIFVAKAGASLGELTWLPSRDCTAVTPGFGVI